MKEMAMKHAIGAALALSLCLVGHPALADAIDGEWCNAEGRRLAISGPNIVTPGGTKTTGNYDRHGFDLVLPAGEPGGGQKMVMILLGEELMQSRTGTGTAVSWKRCGKPVSMAPAPLPSARS
jgi:hypothetical protein